MRNRPRRRAACRRLSAKRATSSENQANVREGNRRRHAIDWKNPDFWNEDKLNHELERVYDICHGCRRCVSLCNAFPTLFDLIDESSTMEGRRRQGLHEGGRPVLPVRRLLHDEVPVRRRMSGTWTFRT